MLCYQEMMKWHQDVVIQLVNLLNRIYTFEYTKELSDYNTESFDSRVCPFIEKQYLSCCLETVESITYNTKMFTFKLPGASYVIVPTGHHVRVKAKDQQGIYIAM